MTIRPEVERDWEAVGALHRAAFPTPAEAGLVADLRAAGKAAISLVAEAEGRVVGHILFSPVGIEGRSAPGLGLAPLAVAPEQRRRGIGSRLIRDGLAAARSANHAYVVVLGDPAYDARFGFRAAGSLGLGNAYGAGEEFQVLCLREAALPSGGGLVLCASEFARFGP